MTEDLYAQMKQTVLDGEAELAAELAQKGLDAGLAAVDILDLGFVVVHGGRSTRIGPGEQTHGSPVLR